MIKIIGISGKKRSGKDAFCQLLRQNTSIESMRVAFADALKEEVAKATGVTVKFIDDNKAEFRPILQWWGTDFRRRYKGQDYWVRQAFEKILTSPLSVRMVVIPDVRFRSEADYLRQAGAILVRIKRQETEVEDNHSSEVDLDNYEYFTEVIFNNGTLINLAVEARLFLKQHNIPLKQ